MPNLPTVEMTQEQYDQVIDAFGSIETFQEWLLGNVTEYVVIREIQKITEEQSAEMQSRARSHQEVIEHRRSEVINLMNKKETEEPVEETPPAEPPEETPSPAVPVPTEQSQQKSKQS